MDTKEIFTVPVPLQIVLDDVGWFCGYDSRKEGGPSRTGINRFHKPDDYRAIEELGSKLDMKINCAFVLGEWDMTNDLKKLPNFSHYGELWDNAKYRNKSEMEEIVDIVNNSPHIDMAIHGLYHGYYMDGTDNKDESDYYYKINKELYMVPEAQVRQRLDTFLELVNIHGFKKSINSFVPPSFSYRKGELSKILADYGIKYMSTIFKTMFSDEKEEYAVVENGIINCDRINNKVPWYALGFDFSILTPMSGVCGLHWPNICGVTPENYMRTVEKATDYFKKCGKEFGTVLSKDIAFCASQDLYKRYVNTALEEDEVTLDFSKVPKASGLNKYFFVSTKAPITMFDGCGVEEYEKFESHTTYKVTPYGTFAKLFF